MTIIKLLLAAIITMLVIIVILFISWYLLWTSVLFIGYFLGLLGCTTIWANIKTIAINKFKQPYTIIKGRK